MNATESGNEMFLKAREPELQIIEETIHKARDKNAFKCVLNFYGLRGIGKSTFLKAVQILAKEENQFIALFALSSGKTSTENPISIAEIVLALLADLRRSVSDLHQADIPEFNLPLTDKLINNFEHRFVRIVEQLAEPRKCVLLLIDNADSINPEVFQELEDRIIAPLAETSRVVFILTSQGQLEDRWTRFNIRRRVSTYKLSPYTEDLVKEQNPKLAKIAFQIVSTTGGFPSPTKDLILELEETLPSDEFQRREEEFLRKYYQEYIIGYILNGLDFKLQNTLEYLSVLRRFDVGLLRAILPRLVPREYRGFTVADYLGLIGHFTEKNFVEWRYDVRGYAVNDDLKYILSHYAKTCWPEYKYVKTHKTVSQAYSILLRRSSDNGVLYKIEEIYHRLCQEVGKVKSQDEAQSQAANDLINFAEQLKRSSVDDLVDELDDFKRRFEKDRELASMLGPANTQLVKDGLQYLIRERAEEPQRSNILPYARA